MGKNKTINLTDRVIMHTYKRIPLVVTKAKGIYLWDDAGKKYMDFLGSRGAANVGHSNPDVVKAIAAQAKQLILAGNDFYTLPQTELAQILVKHSFADQVFFCSSGAEANEAAIKLSRLYSFKTYGQGRHVIISAANSFHGRTYGALSATGQQKYQTGFEPMLPGFRYVNFNDIEEMDASLDDDVCAVILEPVQGEGGVYPASSDYIKFVREQTGKKDILFIMDEVQAGLGRTGRLFAYENYKIKPDIVTIAKSIAGGVPMGAVLANKKVSGFFIYGTHGTTFGGAPISAAAGIAAMRYLIRHNLSANANKLGKILQKRLLQLKGRFGSAIKDVRGMGLIVGIEFYESGIPSDIFYECLKHGLIINITNGNIIRFLPPLIITENELIRGIDIFEKAVEKCTASSQKPIRVK